MTALFNLSLSILQVYGRFSCILLIFSPLLCVSLINKFIIFQSPLIIYLFFFLSLDASTSLRLISLTLVSYLIFHYTNPAYFILFKRQSLNCNFGKEFEAIIV